MSETTILVTGAAGFIGAAVARALLDEGARVVGVDNLNDYYAPALKRARLDRLSARKEFVFRRCDIADHEALAAIPEAMTAGVVVHLAAQAGVRYSLDHPFAYASANLVGHLSVLELVRRSPAAPRLVYASSSSVYGANAKSPFSESDPVVQPVSLYAATKRADELMSEAYARLYGLPQIGLRFFTVYGPWGRPDMAYWTFTENILAGRPIRVFNYGRMKRDFTYIDDAVKGVIATALAPPKFGAVPHRVYNIGDCRPVELLRFIEILEEATGRKAEKVLEPMQKGEVAETCADIAAIGRDYGYSPKVPLEEGLPEFVRWYASWRAG